MYESLSESQGAPNSSDASPGSSQVNPFSRQGGTILLPILPAPGPSQHQASGSSLGLQLSQGHTQMYGGRLNGGVEDISVIFFVSFLGILLILFEALKPKICLFEFIWKASLWQEVAILPLQRLMSFAFLIFTFLFFSILTIFSFAAFFLSLVQTP